MQMQPSEFLIQMGSVVQCSKHIPKKVLPTTSKLLKVCADMSNTTPAVKFAKYCIIANSLFFCARVHAQVVSIGSLPFFFRRGNMESMFPMNRWTSCLSSASQ